MALFLMREGEKEMVSFNNREATHNTHTFKGRGRKMEKRITNIKSILSLKDRARKTKAQSKQRLQKNARDHGRAFSHCVLNQRNRDDSSLLGGPVQG